MKRLLISVLVASAPLAADTLLEARGAYYLPSSSVFRDIYSSSGMYGLEASVQTWDRVYTWASASIFVKEGHSIGFHEKTRIAFYPIGLGFKYLYPWKRLDFYAGAGVLAAYMHIHDHSTGIPHKTCRMGGGGILKSGFLVNCMWGFFFDLFTDYSFLYVPVERHLNLSNHGANLSGWSFGLGLGWRFGCVKPPTVCCE